jgi:mono/diheme cytochrome c family protein
MMRRIGWGRLLAFVLIIENGFLAFPIVRDFVLSTEESPAARGRQVAVNLGCFNCHGPDGRGNVPNHGSKYDTVPGFGEQTLMMFVKSDAELREYILDGAPQRRRQSDSYREEMAAQALQMPAFRGWVSDRDVDALVAYLRIVSGLLRPKDAIVIRGEQLAAKLGCFSCHGEMGMGGRPNPGSLKGYIPGFLGEDFHELVRDDDELMTWLHEGALPRIGGHGLGGLFFKRQRIRMPKYKRFVSEEDLQALAAYVRWLAAGSWRHEQLSP